jgi:hypothetical protein
MAMSDNLPALIPDMKSAVMPTVEKFANALRLKTYESGAIDWNVYIAPNRLIPVPACNSILAELEASSAPARKPIAARLAALLIGSYPAREMGNAEIFISVVTATFGRYPPEIGAAAAEKLICASKWLPSVAELTEACNRLMDERRYAAHVVRKHLEHHAEIERERELKRKRIAERAARYTAEPWLELVDHFSLTNPGLRCAPDPDGALYWLVTEFGAAQVRTWLSDMEQDPDGMPRHWPAFQTAMAPLMQAARRARDDGGDSK